MSHVPIHFSSDTLLSTQIPEILRAIDLDRHSVVWMHSALWAFGTRQFRGQDGVERVNGILEALLGFLSPHGTLAVPTFTYGRPSDAVFAVGSTASTGMGMLAEAVRQHPRALRSPHPLQSVAAIGPAAADICGRDTSGAFNAAGPFDRMLELDCELLFLGASMQACSFVHIAEERCAVPYRTWKTFDARCETPDGIVSRSYRMFVRDLVSNPGLDLAPIAAELRRAGSTREVTVGSATVSACKGRQFVRAATSLLEHDPAALLKRPEIKA